MKKPKKKRNYFVQSGLKEISSLRKHFNIKGQADNVEVVGEVSLESMRSFFREYLASVRPKNLGEDKIFPRPDKSKVRALYVGHPDVNVLLNLVVRHCLYVDQIVIIDPLMRLPHEDVMEHPESWIQAVINRALCLCALEEWIEQELIIITPDIQYYTPEISQAIAQMPDVFTPHFTAEQEAESRKNVIVRFLISLSPQMRLSMLDVLSEMGEQFKVGDSETLLEEIEEYEAKYPIRFRLSPELYNKYFKGEKKFSQVIDFSYSAPLLLTPFLAEELGGFLVFEHRYLHDLILSKSKQLSVNPKFEMFQQLAIAFQGLDFPFLHNVTLKQALAIRKKGYLFSFRLYLRELWSAISQTEENERLDDRLFEFTERLKAEYETLEREWKRIRKELRFNAITSGLTVGFSAGSAIAVGNLSVAVIAGLASGMVKESVSGYAGSAGKLKEIQQKPLSIFLFLNE